MADRWHRILPGFYLDRQMCATAHSFCHVNLILVATFRPEFTRGKPSFTFWTNLLNRELLGKPSKSRNCFFSGISRVLYQGNLGSSRLSPTIPLPPLTPQAMESVLWPNHLRLHPLLARADLPLSYSIHAQYSGSHLWL